MVSEHLVIGLMSGSSLDGLDICLVRFKEKQNGEWSFEIVQTDYESYPESFQNELRNLPHASAYQLAQMHTHYAIKQAGYIQQFFKKFPVSKEAELIVSHGQTVFHQPESSFTTQIGCGATLSAKTNKTVVCDLRTYDVALGGQGAPLVPFGEQYLFDSYDTFLNIGGICNISLHKENEILAYDVCPANTLLNLLAHQENQAFDEGGQIAQKGNVNQELLGKLAKVKYYYTPAPKSLGTEHIMSDWWPEIEANSLSIEDKMATVVEHIAMKVGSSIQGESVLITGGGAYNTYLIDRIKYYTLAEIVIPPKVIIDYKEALIIGFVGLMRYLGRNNFIASVTGAMRDNMGGAIYG